MSQLAEYGLLEKNVVTVVESVRETVVMAVTRSIYQLTYLTIVYTNLQSCPRSYKAAC